MGLKFRIHGTELHCEYVDPSICFGGSQSSGSSSSQGYGSSYSQSASLSLPEEMNPTTGNLGNTEGLLSNIYSMLNGGASGNNLLQNYLAPYGGNMVAPVTAAQNQTLGNLGAASTGNFGSFDPTLQAVYNQLVGEATNPMGFGTSVANAGTGANSAVGAGQALASGLAGPGAPTVGEGQFASNLATGGAIQRIIQEAEQPITTAFNTQTMPGLVGNATQAGQRTGGPFGMGSSAFNAASANAQAQEGANLGATAASIANPAFETGLNQYANAYGQGVGNYTNLFNSGLNIGANAPGQITGLTSGEISNLISTLNAQALPQLTEQQGINNALSTYNSSVASILQALGLQVQAEQPAIGYASESASNSASFQNESSSGQQSGFSFQI